MYFIQNKYIKICINSKNALHRLFPQYLENEFSDLRLVLTRWVKYEVSQVSISFECYTHTNFPI